MNDVAPNAACLAQLTILNGKQARQTVTLPEGALMIGRASDCQLHMVEKGVWERHVQIRLRPEEGFFLHPLPPASTLVNSEPVLAPRLLRNGDVLDVGEVKLRFWLGPVQQESLSHRETFFWMLLVALFAAQLWLIWKLG